MLLEPVAGAEVKVKVLSFIVYATLGSCLTLSTKTSIALAPPALLPKVNVVSELFPLKVSLVGEEKTAGGDAPRYAILCYLHYTQTGICTVCCI